MRARVVALFSRETYIRELERIAPGTDYALLCRGYLSALQGDRTTAMAVIEKLNTVLGEGYSRRDSSVGFVYYALGAIDRYFDHMTRAAKNHTLQLIRVRLSPLLAAARKDPRLLELLATYTTPIQPVK